MHNRRINNDVFGRESYQEGEEKRNFGSPSLNSNHANARNRHVGEISDTAAERSALGEAHHQGRSSLLAMNPSSSLAAEIAGIAHGLQDNFSERGDGDASAPSSIRRLPSSDLTAANVALQAAASRSTPSYYQSSYIQNQPSTRQTQASTLQGSAPIPQNAYISTALHEVQESQARLMIHINRASELVQKCPPTSRLSTDEHQSKLPVAEKKIIIPCRARGMPADHSTKTAYLVIKEGMQHGDPLLCTHDVCRKRGVRFLYCAYCDEPVAKGNFSTRHSHPGQERRGSQSKDDSSGANKKKPHEDDGDARSGSRSSENSSSHGRSHNDGKLTTLAAAAASSVAGGHGMKGKPTRRRHQPATTKAPRERTAAKLQKMMNANIDEETYSTESSRNTEQDQDQDDTEAEYDDYSSASSLSQGHRKKSARSATEVESNTKNESHTSRKWESLLEERPTTSDGDELKSWLARVIAYSEPTSNHGVNSDASGTGAMMDPPSRPRTTDPEDEQLARKRGKHTSEG